jgi:hypothetical protein
MTMTLMMPMPMPMPMMLSDDDEDSEIYLTPPIEIENENENETESEPETETENESEISSSSCTIAAASDGLWILSSLAEKEMIQTRKEFLGTILSKLNMILIRFHWRTKGAFLPGYKNNDYNVSYKKLLPKLRGRSIWTREEKKCPEIIARMEAYQPALKLFPFELAKNMHTKFYVETYGSKIYCQLQYAIHLIENELKG